MLYVEQFESAQCQSPGCTHEDETVLMLSPPCHPQASMVVAYLRGKHLLRFRCRRCQRCMHDVAVARQPAEEPSCL